MNGHSNNHIVVAGEALIDLVGEPGTTTYHAHPGGSPANVAAALARLDAQVELVTSLGRDTFGELIRKTLRDSGVRVCAEDRGAATSLAIAAIGTDGSAQYDFRVTWDPGTIDVDVLDGAAAVHTGSLATLLEPGATAVSALLAEARSRGITTSYDPNIRPALAPSHSAAVRSVEDCVRSSDIVKASAEDVHWLYPDVDPTEVARRWVADGTRLAVITAGGAGAVAVTRETTVSIPSIPVTVADTIGAGDAFTAGLLDALRRQQQLSGLRRLPSWDHADITRAMRHASAVAALTCARQGANPPSWAELISSLGEYAVTAGASPATPISSPAVLGQPRIS